MNYVLEPILSSELILVNNSKKLKEDPSLFNDEMDKLTSLRDEYIRLEENGGNRKEKRKIRDEITQVAQKTYVKNDGNDFGLMIMRMTEGIVSRPQFSGYTMKDEMKSLALQYIVKYTHNFDPLKTSKISGSRVSAFAYVSQIIFNACIHTINKFNREQQKAKTDFLETQKLIHRDPCASTFGPEFEDAKVKVQLPNLEPGGLLKEFHSRTITEATEFWIPEDYKISTKEHDFVIEYVHNISVRRIKK